MFVIGVGSAEPMLAHMPSSLVHGFDRKRSMLMSRLFPPVRGAAQGCPVG
jgi:hypothetical protein